MESIIKVIKEIDDMIVGTGADNASIQAAEAALNLSFSEEYREYVRHYGCMSFDGRELTGISSIERFDVVAITQQQRKFYPDLPSEWYVIEQLNIDGIVIWQSDTGKIYQTMPYSAPEKICDSLSEYIEN